MCEILAEFLARGAYLARSADHTNRMPLDLIGATNVARLAMHDPGSPCRLTGFQKTSLSLRLRAGVCEDVNVSELPVPQKHPWHIGRMLTAWAVAAVLGVLVTVLVTGEQRFHWLVFTVGLSTLVTFALQLGTAQREGFITRTSFSVAGSVLIIAVIDVIGLLV